ncbi:MAG TPA: bifunctional nuclease family protein [Gemmatimonadaceae bacterium]|jgi:bifunctional DNase/RNase|nr:bifunctional nuclease family protein [Gemmatimonadaceae bacterium]
MVEVVVARMGVDSTSRAYVVILQEKDGDRVLPIWIGQPEAESIVMEMRHLRPSRPLTHDLCRSLIVGLGGTLRRVQVTRVEDNTYYAELHIVRDGELVQVDARPSDSIAIALRLQAPIFAAEELLTDEDTAPEDGEAPPAPPDASEFTAEQLKKYLEQLRPEDFGRFTP